MKKILFLFLVIVLYSGCKKYSDGPTFSLQTKEHRVAGEWHVEYFSINGIDSTNYLKSKPLFGYYNFDKQRNQRCEYRYFSDDGSYVLFGRWEFVNNKKCIEISTTTSTSGTPILQVLGPYGASTVVWEITRLKEKEMWLKTNYADGREYLVKLKQ